MSKNSFYKRSVSILGLASKVALKETSLKIKSLAQSKRVQELSLNITRIKQAKDITENLAELKGAAMKAGQLLSIDSSNYLPPEAMEILSQLQAMAEPEQFPVIESVLKDELGDLYYLFANLNSEALAAASIGQVHTAKLRGQRVAIKVQYPGVLESIDSDLALLQKVISVFMLPTQKKMDFSSTFEELAHVLKLESDYLYERQMLERYREHLIGDPFFYVPQAFPDMSTSKVLTMEYCEGISINDWLKTNPAQEQKNLLAKKFLDLFHREFFTWHIVQTDPNFGNYLIQEDPFKVILLDFGSTLSYTQEFVKDYVNIIRLSLFDDAQEMFDKAVALGLMDKRESSDVVQAFFELIKVAVEPSLPENQPFNFASHDYEKKSLESVLAFTKSLKYTAPPREIIFLHRKLGGLFALFKRLEAQFDLGPFWSKIINYSATQPGAKQSVHSTK